MDDVKKVLSYIPEEFLKGIRAIILCQGSTKQLKIRKCSTFGVYSSFYKSICLFPTPKHNKLYFRHRPQPHKCQEFERHGAVWDQNQHAFLFSKEAMKSFYMDVLVHEIGHHVSLSIQNRRHDYKSKERFAKWFAMEYGMRFRRKRDSSI